MKKNLGCLLFILLFSACGNQAPIETWQGKLSDEGWVKINRKLTDFTDYTWYGQQGNQRNSEGFVYYLTPSGKKGFLQLKKEGKIYIDNRSQGKDGFICSQINGLRDNKTICDNSLWKKGDL